MKKIIGPLIFLIIAAVIGYVQFFGPKSVQQKPSPSKDKITVSLFMGGEKSEFAKNPEVIRILADKYGITMNPVKAGSIEMVSDLALTDKDALWPSSQIAVELFRKKGGTVIAEENIFNSPIVLYAYDIVSDALIKEKIVEERAKVFYVVDMPKLVRYIQEDKTWKDVGLPQLYGKLAVHTTDPIRSNSGMMFAGLIANTFNQNEVLTLKNADQIIPKVKDYFQSRGYMESSSGDIFKNFITTGVGAKPLIVGYENQMVEFSIGNQKYIDYLKQKIRILYPEPTVWTSHPMIALNPKGKRLIEALKDSGIQKIAWEKHGFRSGLMGVENDPSLLNVVGIPKEITSVMPMPDAEVMSKMIESLKN